MVQGFVVKLLNRRPDSQPYWSREDPAGLCQEEMRRSSGTVGYAAPEMLKGRETSLGGAWIEPMACTCNINLTVLGMFSFLLFVSFWQDRPWPQSKAKTSIPAQLHSLVPQLLTSVHGDMQVTFGTMLTTSPVFLWQPPVFTNRSC